MLRRIATITTTTTTQYNSQGISQTTARDCLYRNLWPEQPANFMLALWEFPYSFILFSLSLCFIIIIFLLSTAHFICIPFYVLNVALHCLQFFSHLVFKAQMEMKKNETRML